MPSYTQQAVNVMEEISKQMNVDETRKYTTHLSDPNQKFNSAAKVIYLVDRSPWQMGRSNDNEIYLFIYREKMIT